MNSQKSSGFSRREVLAGSLGVAGLAALGAWPAFGAAADKKGMKIGCGTVCLRKLPLEEALERIRRAGYEYVETQATGPWCPHVDPWKDDPKKFAELVKKAGFKGVTGLWSSHGALIPDDKSVEGVIQTLRWAKEAGIPVVHAGDGGKPDALSEEDAAKLLSERLAQILAVAEACKVYLAIEPHGTFSLTADGLKKIMGLSPSKWLGINYDTANVHRTLNDGPDKGGYPWKLFGQRQNEVDTLKAVADRVVHVHVKDVVGSQCVALGTGQVNIPGCVQVLKAQGYAGVLSRETEGDCSNEETQKILETSFRYLTDVVAKA